MQGATTYQAKRGSPTALTVVVLLHGAAIGALALSKTEMVQDIMKEPVVIDIPLDKTPPPPEPPKPVEKVIEAPQHVSRVTTPPVIVPTPAPTPTFDTSPVPTPPVFEYTKPAETYIAPPPPPPPPPPAPRPRPPRPPTPTPRPAPAASPSPRAPSSTWSPPRRCRASRRARASACR